MCKTERHTWNLSLSVEHVQKFCSTWQILLFMWIKITPHSKQFVMTQHENFHSTWWIYNICYLIVIYPVLSQHQLCRDLRVFGVKLVSNFWAGNDVGSCVCSLASQRPSAGTYIIHIYRAPRGQLKGFDQQLTMVEDWSRWKLAAGEKWESLLQSGRRDPLKYDPTCQRGRIIKMSPTTSRGSFH